MKITKTQGYMERSWARKGYVINTECGCSFILSPRSKGTGFEYNGQVWKTKKAFKDFVEEGGLEESDEETSTLTGEDTWDCAHPCALLILSNIDHPMEPKFSVLEMETLDCYGWLDENGNPDINRANRELDRVERLKNAN